MSLDVYLKGEEKRVKCTCECGYSHEKIERDILYSSNITHNLNAMADEAGIYEACWRPEEIGATKAKDIIESLSLAIDLMEKDPKRFKKFNSPNGWGTYDKFLRFVKDYLDACKNNPDAIIEVSR